MALILWSASALLAALLGWLPHASRLLAVMSDNPGMEIRSPEVVSLMIPCLIVSGIGAIAFIRPHAGLVRRHVIAALCAVLLYVPLYG